MQLVPDKQGKRQVTSSGCDERGYGEIVVMDRDEQLQINSDADSGQCPFTSSSAIWTAFVAAPFLTLSATIQRLSPFAMVSSRLILPT